MSINKERKFKLKKPLENAVLSRGLRWEITCGYFFNAQSVAKCKEVQSYAIKAECDWCLNPQGPKALTLLIKAHPIWVMIRCADTGRVPPASGVMVSAAAFPAGLRTVKTELTAVVVMTAIPTI